MNDGTTYDVRVYRTDVYKGVKVTTYRVRWKAGNREWRQGFRTAAQADSFRSALLTAARKGEAFSLATGRPTAWEREKAETTWYEFACTYVDMKWKQASAKYRKDIARALTAATPAMLPSAHGQLDRRASAGRWCGGDSIPSSVRIRPPRLPRFSRGSAATALLSRRWPRLQPRDGCSTRQPAAWMAKTQPRAPLASCGHAEPAFTTWSEKAQVTGTRTVRPDRHGVAEPLRSPQSTRKVFPYRLTAVRRGRLRSGLPPGFPWLKCRKRIDTLAYCDAKRDGEACCDRLQTWRCNLYGSRAAGKRGQPPYRPADLRGCRRDGRPWLGGSRKCARGTGACALRGPAPAVPRGGARCA